MADGRCRTEVPPGRRCSPRHRARALICCLAAAPTKGGPFADAINAATKSVATHRREGLEWGPVGDLGPDVVGGIRRVKSTDGPDLIVWGSSTLTPVLLEHGLVDEVVLLVYPVLLGRGKRCFSDTADPREFALVSTKATPSGVLINIYRHVGPVRTG
jgi:dihydrofolate reductase